MEAPDVPGATGFTDTDYEAKAGAALDLLRGVDLVYVHVEAIDEMGHSGDVGGKIGAIEDFDSRLASNLVAGLESRGLDYTLAVIPDHYTPCTVRTHVRDPTPFVIAGHGPGRDGTEYDEENAKIGSLGLLEGDAFIKMLVRS
jgi:2,3-bisphosphoglycerate-independent phosphoglycerate mutase